MKNAWNTELPDPREVKSEADRLAEKGIDVHTVMITLNGQSGDFDVQMLATNADMDDLIYDYTLGRYGALEAIRKEAS